MTELTHTKDNCTANDLCLGGKDGLFCGNCSAGIEQTEPLDTYLQKDEWTDAHHALYATIPAHIREIAGDLFEIKWYGGGGLEWELEHNLLGTKEKAKDFMSDMAKLTRDQTNLIYYAYEA